MKGEKIRIGIVQSGKETNHIRKPEELFGMNTQN